MKHIPLALLCLLFLAVPALANDKFNAMDANKDGSVSWEEFQTTYPSMKREAFDAIDVNKDGGISLEEWIMFTARHQEGRMGSPGMKGMPPGMGGDRNEGGHMTPAPLITPPASPAPFSRPGQ